MTEHEQLIGSVLDGKYRVDRLIGRGGMGSVFAGTHLHLERQVAIKVLKAELLADQVAVARFVREAKAAARIEHPNAIGVYDFGPLEDGCAFLVMEFVEGEPLRHIISSQAPLPLAIATDLVQQAGAAIAAAHARGIIHRDIKPENMMVRVGDEEGRFVLKVVDFGIAKLLSSESATQLTNPHELVGTPKYMAPEQFSGEHVDERIDIYALGIVLYELLAGRAPFEGTFSEVIGKHLYAAPLPLSALGIDVPEAVEDFLQKALAKDPAERFASAAQFVRELVVASGIDVGAYIPPSRPLPEESTPISRSLLPTFGRLSGKWLRRGHDDGARTRYGTGSDDQLTHAREGRDEPELPTVFVPSVIGRRGGATAPTPFPTSSTLAPGSEAARPTQSGVGRATAGGLALTSARRRWQAPAIAGLAVMLLFSGTALQSGHGASSDIPDAPSVFAPARAAMLSAADASAEPDEAREPGASERARRASPDGERRADSQSAARAVEPGQTDGPRAESRRASRESRRAFQTRRAYTYRNERDGAGRKLGRALRIDRHLRRLF